MDCFKAKNRKSNQFNVSFGDPCLSLLCPGFAAEQRDSVSPIVTHVSPFQKKEKPINGVRILQFLAAWEKYLELNFCLNAD